MNKTVAMHILGGSLCKLKGTDQSALHDCWER